MIAALVTAWNFRHVRHVHVERGCGRWAGEEQAVKQNAIRAGHRRPCRWPLGVRSLPAIRWYGRQRFISDDDVTVAVEAGPELGLTDNRRIGGAHKSKLGAKVEVSTERCAFRAVAYISD